MAALDYWVLVPSASEMNVAGTVPNAFIVSVQQGSAVDKQLLGNFTGRVTVGGRSGYLRAGPYTTLAAAQAYLKVGAQNANTPVPGVQVKPGGGLAVTNPLNGLLHWALNVTGISGWFARALKVGFGGILMIMGIAKLTHSEDKILKVAPIAAKALMV